MRVPAARNLQPRRQPLHRRDVAMAEVVMVVMVAMAAVAALAGCGSGERTVTTDLGLARVVTGQGVELAVERAAVDSANLRAGALPADTVSGGVVPAPSTTAPAATALSMTSAGSTPPEPADLAQGEGRSLELINELRAGLGLPALVRDETMDAFAREWSRQMAESGAFEHSASPYGENIAYTSNTELTAAEAAEAFSRLWVDSEVHYANMTAPYATVGIGVYRTDQGWYGTHVYSY
jgi:uncharacterized protein YkwD